MDLLREMVETNAHQDEMTKLNETYAKLQKRYSKCLDKATTLVEGAGAANVDDFLMGQLEEVSQRFEAAKRGLGLVNKLPKGPSRAKHSSRILGNMNRIRGLLRRVEKELSKEAAGEMAIGQNLNVIPQRGEKPGVR